MTVIEQEVNMKKLATMIRGIKVAMLTTINPDGSLHSRPMATHDVDFDGTLWFFTRISAEKIDEVQFNPQVNASYVAVDEHRYISLSGRATVSQDPDKMKELWSPADRPWFPRGLDDPDLALLRVEVDRAGYWDMLSARMVELI